MEPSNKKHNKKFGMEALHKLGEGAALTSPQNISEPGRQKHPGGRPPKKTKANRVFNINFYESDFEALSLNAELHGMPIATYIKSLIKQGGGFEQQSTAD